MTFGKYLDLINGSSDRSSGQGFISGLSGATLDVETDAKESTKDKEVQVTS